MWIQLQNNLLDHPKLIRLSNKLRAEKAHTLGILSGLWLWASKYAPDGNLSKFEAAEIATGAGWHELPEVLLKALTETSFLDQKDNQLLIHDWDDNGIRCLKQSRERQKSYRERKVHDKPSMSAALHASQASLS
ncbi:MAG TPA: hypothetical protein PLO78_10120 [Candidatus Omnitrophota bacterium]|nr:hypothetical protein [Candidatus Omnitrophota bacterium]